MHSKVKIKIMKEFFLDVVSPSCFLRLHDDLFYRKGDATNSAWLENKSVDSMVVDHCDDSLLSTFNRYRTAASVDDMYKNENDVVVT